MESWRLIFEVIALLAAAAVLGLFFESLKQSAVLGYLLAGALLGPKALGLVEGDAAFGQLAELGVALLLFSIGLEFSWKRMKSLGAMAFGGGALQLALTGAAVFALARACGRPVAESIALGAIIGPSSTACVLRALMERQEVESIHGRNAMGILLFQDLALVPMVLLVTNLGGQQGAWHALLDVLQAIGLFGLLGLAFYLLCYHFLPRLLTASSLTQNRELTVLLAALTSFGSAWMAHALHLSPALGAFIAGMLLAESPFAAQVRADIGILRVLFVTLFFASIGMLADFTLIPAHWPAVALILAAILTVKILIVWFVARRFQNTHRNALATGFSLAQVGEFSFVLAAIAKERGAMAIETFGPLLLATVATLFLTPFLVARALPWATRIEEVLCRLGLLRPVADSPGEPRNDLRGHAIVIGMGPAGRGALQAVRSQGVRALVIELNPRTVASARADGFDAQLGDATQQDILRHGRLERASALILALPDPNAVRQIIVAARAVAPRVPIVARARYSMHAESLRDAGADIVIDEEDAMGSLLGEEALKQIFAMREIDLGAGGKA